MSDVRHRLASLRDQDEDLTRWLNTIEAPPTAPDDHAIRRARRALAATRARLDELQDIQKFAEDVSASARVIFEQLPPDEIADDERCDFGELQGRQAVRTASAVYVLGGDGVMRFRPVEGGVERTEFRDGRELGTTVDPQLPGTA